MSLHIDPVVRAHMLIKRPVAVVFEAFVNPDITNQFWFSRGSARLQQNAEVTWHWDMYAASAQVSVKLIEPHQRIVVGWPTPVEWTFAARGGDSTFVTITASAFTGADDDKVAQAIDSMGGFSFVLAGCKALLEHGVRLNLVADHNPDAHAPRT